MSTVSTTKRVDNVQLQAVLGDLPLEVADYGDHREVTMDVDEADLTAAIDAMIPPKFQTLAVDRQILPPDGETAATVTYHDADAPAGEVTFAVNGATKTVALTAAGNAFLDVVSSTPGDTIVVTVDALPGVELTITVAEEA